MDEGYCAHRQYFNHRLTSLPQPGPLQGIPRKSSNCRPTPKTSQNQKKWVPGTQKSIKKTPTSRLNIIQFTEHVKKWNLTKTTVFTLFQHVRPQILLAFPHPNPPKNTPQNRHCKLVTPNRKKKQADSSKSTPKWNPKSIKNQWKSNPGPQGVPFGVPADPWMTNMVTQGQKSSPQGIKMEPQGLQNYSFWPN
jgi:hypothetical protein